MSIDKLRAERAEISRQYDAVIDKILTVMGTPEHKQLLKEENRLNRSGSILQKQIYKMSNDKHINYIAEVPVINRVFKQPEMKSQAGSIKTTRQRNEFGQFRKLILPKRDKFGRFIKKAVEKREQCDRSIKKVSAQRDQFGRFIKKSVAQRDKFGRFIKKSVAQRDQFGRFIKKSEDQ